MYKFFCDQQQKMYQDFMQNYFANAPYMEGYKKAYEAMLESTKKYQNPWADVQSKLAALNPFSAMLPPVSFTDNNPWSFFPSMKEGDGAVNPFTWWMPSSSMLSNWYTSRVPGFDTFTKMFEFWKGMESPTEFVKNYSDQYMKLMESLMGNIFPDGTMAFISKPKELIDTCIAFYRDIMHPWMELDESLLDRISKGDTKACVQLFRDINSKYDESFSKVFNMAGLGLNRESYEKQMKAINLSYKQMFIAAELFSMVYDTMLSTMQVLIDRYQELIKTTGGAVTFKDFYDMWYKVNEEALTDMLNTDEFAKAFGEMADVSGQYIQAMNAVYEQALSKLPIPTKTDMDSLYKTVYTIRKDLREVKKKINSTETV